MGRSSGYCIKERRTFRFCVDFCKLNAITARDSYPIDDTLDALTGMRYFTSLDLAAGYWQIEMDEKDKHKSAFVTKQRLFEFNVMPFGPPTHLLLFNAPWTLF